MGTLDRTVLGEIARTNSSSHIRCGAIEKLCDGDDSSVVSVLVEALRDEDPAVRSRAREGLERIDWHPQTHTDRAFFLVAGCGRGIGTWDVKGVDDAQAALLLARTGVYGEWDEEYRASAVRALRNHLNDTAVVDWLVSAAYPSKAIAAAVDLLREIGDDRATQALIRLLGPGRNYIYDALVSIGSPAAIADLFRRAQLYKRSEEKELKKHGRTNKLALRQGISRKNLRQASRIGSRGPSSDRGN